MIFNVQLSNPLNGIIGNGIGVGTIIDNDSASGSFIINGTKFLDLDSSHARENYSTEVGLTGWNVTLFDSSNIKIDSMFTQPDLNPIKHGWFKFIVSSGNYKLCEKDENSGFWETLPYPGYSNWDFAPSPTPGNVWHPYCYSITVTGSDVINNMIGNNNTLAP